MAKASGTIGELHRPETLGSVFEHGGNRGPGFDTVRLLAASAVVFHHSLAIKYDIVAIDLLNAFSGGYTHLGFLSVSIFFALSGFLVTPGLTRSGDVLAYLSRRFMRIMPLLLLVVAVTALVVGPLVSNLPAEEYFTRHSTWRYFRNTTTWLSLQLPGVTDYDGGSTINGPMWTLHYEWMCYLLLALLQLAAILRHRLFFLASWLGVSMLSVLIYYDIVPGTLRMFELMSYFGAGSLLYLFRDRVYWSWTLMALVFGVLVFALGLGLGIFVAPLLIAYLVIGLGPAKFPWNAIIHKADLSYGIYLTHSVIFVVIMRFWPTQSPHVLFATGWSLAALTAFMTWTFLEKPALRHKDAPAILARRILGPRLSMLFKRGAVA